MSSFLHTHNCKRLTGFKLHELLELTGIQAIHPDIDLNSIDHFLAVYSHNVTKIEFITDILKELRITIDQNTMVITNDYIKLQESVPSGSNFGIKWIIAQVESARSRNFNFLECTAWSDEDMHGGYTWSRYGFIMDDTKCKQQFLRRMKDLGRQEKNLEELMSTKEGREVWKKNPSSYPAYFNLSKNSKSSKILNETRKEYGL